MFSVQGAAAAAASFAPSMSGSEVPRKGTAEGIRRGIRRYPFRSRRFASTTVVIAYVERTLDFNDSKAGSSMTPCKPLPLQDGEEEEKRFRRVTLVVEEEIGRVSCGCHLPSVVRSVSRPKVDCWTAVLAAGCRTQPGPQTGSSISFT